MIKVFFISSENNNSFGVNRVLYDLKNFLKKKCYIKRSSNFYDFINTEYNIIHIHGCWKLYILFYFILSKIKKLKIIISPHGMLDPYSLNQKKIRKIIFWHLFRKHILKFSDQIIVNSLNEKKNVLKIVDHKKIIIIPHGIKFIKQKYDRKKNYNKKLNFVFFSRIDHVKNLDKLVKIWISNPYFENLKLSIYGEISDHKYFNLINHKISKYKNIKYYGALNKNKIKILAKYDVFIFPSKSENFGLVVLEAMAAGLYIVLNKKLPWKNIASEGFASLIYFNNTNLTKEIKNLIKRKSQLRSVNYFNKIKMFLHKNYNWKNISKIYLLNYKKLLK